METTEQSEHRTSGRSFLVKGAALGAGTLGAGRLLADPPQAFASGGLTKGDAASLRFLAAAEILETDMWQQYNELAGIQDAEVPGGSGNPDYTEAVAVLDEDMAQYIHDNTDDEISHAAFINATCRRTAPKRSTWTSSAPCQAARPPARNKSGG